MSCIIVANVSVIAWCAIGIAADRQCPRWPTFIGVWCGIALAAHLAGL